VEKDDLEQVAAMSCKLCLIQQDVVCQDERVSASQEGSDYCDI
jgi:hypothetical protein